MALILVVEDLEPLQNLIREALDAGGHKAVCVGSGKEASRLCQNKRFDLIITNILMPEMDGLELIRSLRESHNQVPIIAISGASEQILGIALLLGAVATMQKPFRLQGLVARVDEILASRP
jgi:DNA-binding response OmpR family regulator